LSVFADSYNSNVGLTIKTIMPQKMGWSATLIMSLIIAQLEYCHDDVTVTDYVGNFPTSQFQ